MTRISVGLKARKGVCIHDYITYIHTLHRYIHIYRHIFNFDQSSEYIGIGYAACHKINLTEGNQQSLNKPASHEHKYGQKPHT
jgi:hypothetical protein